MTDETTSTEAATTECACCGEQRPEADVVRLLCHEDVALCGGCLDWLQDQRLQKGGNRLRRAAPILPTADLTRALCHYDALGFETEAWSGGGYGFATRDNVELHFGEVEGLDPGANVAGLYLFVGDADALHAEWTAADAGGRHDAVEPKPWGLHEGHHVDPDGNLLRYGSPAPARDGDASG